VNTSTRPWIRLSIVNNSTGVVDDRRERVAVEAQQRRTRREEQLSLRTDRVRRAVTVRVVVRVVTERVDRLQAFQVDDAQSLPGPDHSGPRFSRAHDRLEGPAHAAVHSDTWTQ
jgi:hypothetical protein